MKKTVFKFWVSALLFLLIPAAWGLSIRVLPGGIPVASPEQLIAEGIRLGSSQLLRQAWSEYEKAVHLEPKLIEGYLQLGRIYFQLSLLSAVGGDDFQRAKSYAEKALILSPKSAESHRAMAMVLSGKGSYLNAMDELRLALTLNPGNEYILSDMAIIHLALRQPDKAVEILEGRSLKSGWSYYVLALAWLQQGQKGRALLNFKKAEKVGFSGYWLDLAFDALKRDLPISLPFMK